MDDPLVFGAARPRDEVCRLKALQERRERTRIEKEAPPKGADGHRSAGRPASVRFPENQQHKVLGVGHPERRKERRVSLRNGS